MHNEPDLAAEGAAAPADRHPLEGIARVLAAVGTVWIFLMMMMVVADVVGRNFLDKPITGVAEFAARSVASIVFLQLAAAICSGRMTRSDFLLRLIGARSLTALRVLEVGNALLGGLLFAALAFIAWPELTQAWTSNEFFGVQGVYTVPTWPFRALIVGGSIVAALAYLLQMPSVWRHAGEFGEPS
ncbi:MAG: TRAP transporter small permease subunit [Hydrogenophaga sp.]|uniref:TRAP transporter small permease subunit n=1 Tax=Hydrogenophaga sp. TaxID=1904254 RepID=UPI00257C7C63|nr:TRAP transporter small permease subunit [Hydrogenophaga sp.]MBL0944561.1 TRAP transporter small permease subunit [Hydrogenophaga sp.]